MISAPTFEKSQQATIYVGNLDPKVNQAILCELFTQVGQVIHVHIPRDKITNEHSGFGFVQFKSEEDADYSIRIMHLVKLFGKPIRTNKTAHDKKTLQVGANLFVGNIDMDVDQKLLYQTFSNFGSVISVKIQRNPQTGQSKGHAFVSFDRFQSSDRAIAALNGKFFSGKLLNVQYAYKKDTKGQRHGSSAQRLLAANPPAMKTSSLFNIGRQVSITMPQSLLNSEKGTGLSIIEHIGSRGVIDKSEEQPGVPRLPLPQIPLS